MKKVFHLFLLLLPALAFGQQDWDQLYISSSINPDQVQNGYSYVEVGPDNTLYLLEAEEIENTFGNWLIRMKSFNGTSWNQIGQDLIRNTANNESHVDFVITETNEFYIGMLDSIFKLNTGTSLWESHYVPEYCGGLSANDNGEVYFIHKTQGASGPAYSDLHLASFDDGSITQLNEIAADIFMLPRSVNASNKINIQSAQFTVSLVAQSTNLIYVFTGDLLNGFTKLEQSAPGNGSTLFADLGLSSMVVSPSGDIIISRKTGNDISIVQYDSGTDSWLNFDTTGIHATSCNFNHLRYDNSGKLHLIYTGSNNSGFLFEYNGTSWEHVGPTSFWSYHTISSLIKPWLCFGNNDEIYFTNGIGTSALPLQVFGEADATADVPQLSSSNITLHPNPASDYTTISMLDEQSQIRVLNQAGQEVAKFCNDLKNQEFTIDVGGLEKGSYLIYIEKDGHTQVKPLIIVH